MTQSKQNQGMPAFKMPRHDYLYVRIELERAAKHLSDLIDACARVRRVDEIVSSLDFDIDEAYAHIAVALDELRDKEPPLA